MKPTHSYFICTTPRTGSSLLSSILAQCGQAGYPWEWFDDSAYPNLFEQVGALDFADYLQKVLAKGTTPNGVFGVKIMTRHFQNLVNALRKLRVQEAEELTTDQLLNAIFPNLRYIWLTRRDKVRQAISYEKANQTGIWRSYDNPFPEKNQKPIFSFQAIDFWIRDIIDQELTWQEYFSQANITPLTLVYEDFYRSTEEVVRRVLDYLEVAPPASWKLGEVGDRKLADSLSDSWAEQYTQQLRTQLQSGLETAQASLRVEPLELRVENNENQAASPDARLIAFYLPQYHPIPENDNWWGKGFTEWRNVVQGTPLFLGHDQPHLPADLGFYDLRLPEVRQAQADLAREYGIYGFCYYHYWFNGRRLLNRPFDEVLASGQPDFPFCLCWANENWTRAWDGLAHDILLQQHYSPDDDRQHIQWLAKAFQDPRYIRVDGKPLFLIYRVSELPDPRQTVDIWRKEAQRLGIGDIYLCLVESRHFDRVDPATVGFDAAVEFQPDWLNLGAPTLILLNNNRIYDYAKIIDRMLQKPTPLYKRFPCVMPGWDNTARRGKDVLVLRGSTPDLYQKWLESVIEQTAPSSPDENLVFINAWNEWTEGAYLEPCQKWGRAYLEATHRALYSAWPTPAAQPSSQQQPQSVELVRRQPVHETILSHAWAQDIARHVPLRRIVKAVIIKVANKTHFRWLYRFRGLGMRLLGG